MYVRRQCDGLRRPRTFPAATSRRSCWRASCPADAQAAAGRSADPRRRHRRHRVHPPAIIIAICATPAAAVLLVSVELDEIMSLSGPHRSSCSRAASSAKVMPLATTDERLLGLMMANAASGGRSPGQPPGCPGCNRGGTGMSAAAGKIPRWVDVGLIQPCSTSRWPFWSRASSFGALYRRRSRSWRWTIILYGAFGYDLWRWGYTLYYARPTSCSRAWRSPWPSTPGSSTSAVRARLTSGASASALGHAWRSTDFCRSGLMALPLSIGARRRGLRRGLGGDPGLPPGLPAAATSSSPPSCSTSSLTALMVYLMVNVLIQPGSMSPESREFRRVRAPALHARGL